MMSDIAMIYRPAELMRVLGLGRNTVYMLLRSGRIRSVKIGRRYLIIISNGSPLASDVRTPDFMTFDTAMP